MTESKISERIPEMIEAARAAKDAAYAPYSGFRVGAAVLDSEGRIFSGCNVENVSYGLAMCAERSAVFQMIRSGGRSIVAVVVYAPAETPSTPCGACRQVLHEFGSQCRVICVCASSERIEAHLDALLPMAFGM